MTERDFALGLDGPCCEGVFTEATAQLGEQVELFLARRT
jgi:hypothetical protein